MGEVWIKEAERLTPVGNHNAMSGIGGPRATLHCTVSNPGSFDAMVRVLRSKSSESHLLYDGKTDRLGQFFPLDRAARALARGTLAYSHNKVGSVNIQIEVCNMPVDWTVSRDWKPGPHFRAMLRAIRSWGIHDEFIYRPAKTPGDRAVVVRPSGLLTSTAGGGKWWGHCHYGQGETHWDPGPINVARFFAAAPTSTPAPSKPAASPPAKPTPIPTTEAPTMFLVQLAGADPVYKSDGFQRVHVTKAQRDALVAAGVKVTVVKTAEALAAFGPEATA